MFKLQAHEIQEEIRITYAACKDLGLVNSYETLQPQFKAMCNEYIVALLHAAGNLSVSSWNLAVWVRW